LVNGGWLPLCSIPGVIQKAPDSFNWPLDRFFKVECNHGELLLSLLNDVVLS
jgi:hypothetical protein